MYQSRFEHYRAMGFNVESAAELATQRHPAPPSLHDLRMQHDDSAGHRNYAAKHGGCPACAAGAEADPVKTA